MALNVVWSPKALDNFHAVITYLEENWHPAVVKDFVSRTEQVIRLISENPNLYRKISSRNYIREALITKHNLLLYRVDHDRFVLLAVFDTRQYPRKKSSR